MIPGLQASSRIGGVLRHLRLVTRVHDHHHLSRRFGSNHRQPFGRRRTDRYRHRQLEQAPALPMKPIPAPRSSTGRPRRCRHARAASRRSSHRAGEYSTSNRRASPTCGAQRAYPWLLSSSTAVAALFCLLYITKPVIPSPAMIRRPHRSKTPATEKPRPPSAATAPPSAEPAARPRQPAGEGDDRRFPADPREHARGPAGRLPFRGNQPPHPARAHRRGSGRTHRPHHHRCPGALSEPQPPLDTRRGKRRPAICSSG